MVCWERRIEQGGWNVKGKSPSLLIYSGSHFSLLPEIFCSVSRLFSPHVCSVFLPIYFSGSSIIPRTFICSRSFLQATRNEDECSKIWCSTLIQSASADQHSLCTSVLPLYGLQYVVQTSDPQAVYVQGPLSQPHKSCRLIFSTRTNQPASLPIKHPTSQPVT